MNGGGRAALLDALVDYAGLFPPAQLDLATALDHFDRHERGPDAAMLGRFVLPVGRLAELAPWLDDPWHAARPLRLSLLARPVDLDRVAAFGAGTSAVAIEAVELRQPVDVEPEDWLGDLLERFAVLDLAGQQAYVELNADNDAAQLAALGARQDMHTLSRLGAKLRCGGVTADLVPPVSRVAAVITLAREHGVPLKFTAGLHHPVRGMDQTEGVPMHGFLNVYGAALLAHADGLSADAIEAVLADTDPASFLLDAGGFSWRDRTVNADRVASLRATALGGFGSCSFTEPVADLRSLSLLT